MVHQSRNINTLQLNPFPITFACFSLILTFCFVLILFSLSLLFQSTKLIIPLLHILIALFLNITIIQTYIFLLFFFCFLSYIDVMHVYAQLYATKYPINESMFVNSAMTNNRKMFYYLIFVMVIKSKLYCNNIDIKIR